MIRQGTRFYSTVEIKEMEWGTIPDYCMDIIDEFPECIHNIYSDIFDSNEYKKYEIKPIEKVSEPVIFDQNEMNNQYDQLLKALSEKYNLNLDDDME